MSGILWDHYDQDPESRRLIPKDPPGAPGAGEAPNLASAGSTPAPGATCTACGRDIDLSEADEFTRWLAGKFQEAGVLWCPACANEEERS